MNIYILKNIMYIFSLIINEYKPRVIFSVFIFIARQLHALKRYISSSKL